MCWTAATGHGNSLKVWFVYPVRVHWRKLIFPWRNYFKYRLPFSLSLISFTISIFLHIYLQTLSPITCIYHDILYLPCYTLDYAKHIKMNIVFQYYIKMGSLCAVSLNCLFFSVILRLSSKLIEETRSIILFNNFEIFFSRDTVP